MPRSVVPKSLTLVVLLVASLAVAPVATAQTQPSFAVTLQTDGDARITLTSTFDLTDEDRRRAFQALVENETAKQSYTARFGDRLNAVAAATADRTGREMSVDDVSLQLEPGEETGVARVSATWSNLAEVQEDALRVTEPFASGFSLDDRVIVVEVPDGYGVSATPEPDSRQGDRLVWAAGTDLSGFELRTGPAEGDDGGTDGGSGSSNGIGPGVGVVGALGALIAASLVAVRRRS